MKMTVDISEIALKEAMKFTGAKTKREAVIHAVEDFNRRHRRAALTKRFRSSMPNFMTQTELKARRAADTAQGRDMKLVDASSYKALNSWCVAAEDY